MSEQTSPLHHDSSSAAPAQASPRFLPQLRIDTSSIEWSRALTVAALVGILVLAGFLRFTHVNWDSPGARSNSGHLHPDERFITMVATGVHMPSSIGEYFDSSVNPLSPYNNEFPTFIYGSFPLYVDKIFGELTGHTVYGNFHMASRSMSAMFDLLTVFFLFLIGKRLFNEKIGLLASLLYALSVLPIVIKLFQRDDKPPASRPPPS